MMHIIQLLAILVSPPTGTLEAKTLFIIDAAAVELIPTGEITQCITIELNESKDAHIYKRTFRLKSIVVDIVKGSQHFVFLFSFFLYSRFFFFF